MTPRRKKVLRIAALLAVVATGLFQFRWVIGGRAIEIIDPVVRRWAVREVARLSDGAYLLHSSPIRVTTADRRVAIDSIVVTTDSSQNAKRSSPLPAFTALFLHCAVNEIDLDRLARRRGFAASRAGCDSVVIRVAVPATAAHDSAKGSFLSLQGDLDLARGVPFVHVDSVVMPHVAVAASLTGSSGAVTSASFDNLAVRLESLHYDPREPHAARQTLLSRNVTLAIDSLETRRQGTDQMRLARLRADLTTGTIALSGLQWEPDAGEFRDSLGLVNLGVDRLDVAGVDWREFFVRGNVSVRSLHLVSPRITIRSDRAPPPTPTRETTSPDAWTLAASLRAINRGVRLDSLLAQDLLLQQLSGGDTTRTRVATLAVAAVDAPERLDATSASPIGPTRIAITGIERATDDRLIQVGRVALDLGAGTAAIDSLRLTPEGTDADFVRRHRYRSDRIALSMATLRLAGLDGGTWVRDGSYRARTTQVHGVDVDILSDKRLPAGRPARRRTPQQWMQHVAPPVALDSVSISGRVRYRERARGAPQPGVLRFEQLDIQLRNLRNIPGEGGSGPMILQANARLMGVAPLSLRLELPLYDTLFNGSFQGRLGPMAAMALNPFLDGAVGARFTGGQVHAINYEATISGGRARGRVQPRYEGLWIELPGVARTGFLSGLKRAIVKFAANQFVVREDNLAGGDSPPRDGQIQHRWQPHETLLQFLWNGVRDALITVVKR